MPAPKIKFAGLFCLLASNAFAATLYVNVNSPSPVAPYTNWATAAATIQEAIDAASPGDLILVTNGTYAVGGRTVLPYSLTNRVAITKPVTVQSVNGSSVTVIQGYQVGGVGCGDSAIRCCYMTNGAVLNGFLLMNGATRTAGDNTHEQSGGGVFCEDSSATVVNCVVLSNSAWAGGGGVCQGSLNNCLIALNSAVGIGYGGGAAHSLLYHCTISSNSASGFGGGASSGSLASCLVIRNSAGNAGGGTWDTGMANCSIFGNTALAGGGVFSGSPISYYNCTIAGNSASFGGGKGSDGGMSFLYNCIIYHNLTSSGPEVADGYQGLMVNCCSPTVLYHGSNNVRTDPILTDVAHIGSNSPCIGAGSAANSLGTDLDGNAWANPPSIGCDEFTAGTAGQLDVTILGVTNLTTDISADYIAQVIGHANSGIWDFGDGTVLSNTLFSSHGWSAPGDYQVSYRAFNDNNPGGVSATVTVHVVQATSHFVSLVATNPIPPFTTWDTAATNIQDAVDAAYSGDTVVVTNGVYNVGQRTQMSGVGACRLVVGKPITIQSVNGPSATTIQGFQLPGTILGDGAVRCVYLASGAKLTGFTLTGGATLIPQTSADVTGSGGGVVCESTNSIVSNCVIVANSSGWEGGGAWSGTLDNCILVSNTASVFPASGGGASRSMLNNCVLAFNSAYWSGGGVYSGTVNNCTIVSNWAGFGGGVYGVQDYDGTMYFATNSIIISNGASNGPNYLGLMTLHNCCTSPLPTNGVGNIAVDPSFVNFNNHNFRLQSNSPCINAGDNVGVFGGTDLDGQLRVAGGTVDIGAYEFQSPASVLSYAWAQQFGLGTDGSADFSDTDGDGMNNWQEWKAGTIPTNAASSLTMGSPVRSGSDIVVNWQSQTNRLYFLLRGTNLTAPLLPFVTNIIGQAGSTSFIDTNSAALGPVFYRVGVQ